MTRRCLPESISGRRPLIANSMEVRRLRTVTSCVLKAGELRMPGIEVVDPVRIGPEAQPGILAISELHAGGAFFAVRSVDRKRVGDFVARDPRKAPSEDHRVLDRAGRTLAL